jgi:DNA-binding NarL/FixJ family response regulator
MRILLVEDQPQVQQQLRAAFADIDGAEVVHVAATADDARAWLASHPDAWELAVIDLFLTAGHGFQVLRDCRGRAEHQRAIVLSNYTRDPVREHARLAGADAVFDKSFEMERLLAWCARLRDESARATPLA